MGVLGWMYIIGWDDIFCIVDELVKMFLGDVVKFLV